MIKIGEKAITKLFDLVGLKKKIGMEFIKFSVVGGFNTVIDFSIYFGLTRNFIWFAQYYLAANALAFITANIFSFFVNKYWTFKVWQGSRWRQYLRFFTVSAVSLLAVEAVLYLLVSYFGIWDVAAKLVTLAVSVMINFLGSKFWAFK